jgi:hypothetical protein
MATKLAIDLANVAHVTAISKLFPKIQIQLHSTQRQQSVSQGISTVI